MMNKSVLIADYSSPFRLHGLWCSANSFRYSHQNGTDWGNKRLQHTMQNNIY